MDEKEPKAQATKESTVVPAKVEAAGHSCPICGLDAADPPLFRFSEYFCSEAHVAEFAGEIRGRGGTTGEAAQRVTRAAATPSAPKKGGTWSLLKMGACCGGALLLFALVPLVAGTGGAFAAVGSSLLSIAALLACPLGMYFMMRGMKRMDHGGKEPGAGKPGTGGKMREPGDDPGR
ncbi:MAG: hypothetical protein L0214_05215 [candidate division NC10 bacterium]|nr:hypothetical protein [candidate division NC10 bacterium]